MKKGIMIGAFLGAAAATAIASVKKNAETFVKKGKRMFKDKVGDIFD